METEISKERESMMDRIRELTKEIRKMHLVIDHYIPATEYMKIERRSVFREDINEWTIPSLEFTGNNIKDNKAKKKKGEKIDADLEGNFLYDHILNFDEDEEEEDYKAAASDRVKSMISNIMVEEGEDEQVATQMQIQPSVFYKYTDTGAEREDPEALNKKKKKTTKGSGRPLTAKKIKKGDIVSMVETMTHGQ